MTLVEWLAVGGVALAVVGLLALWIAVEVWMALRDLRDRQQRQRRRTMDRFPLTIGRSER